METGINFTGLTNFQKTLFNLPSAAKGQIMRTGLLEAAKAINKTAQSNLQATKKGKSRTNYSAYNRAFVANLYKPKDINLVAGVAAGVIGGKRKKSDPLYGVYKLRWIEGGTVPRKYQSVKVTGEGTKARRATVRDHMTGSVSATRFFSRAVKGSYQNSFNIIAASFQKSLMEYWGKTSN